MDAFEQVKNSGKFMKKFTNAAVVINSNDKGLRMVNFVHDLQVYNNTENNIIYVRACWWASYKRNVKYKVKMVCKQSGTPKILAAKCDRQCPASNSGCCCHVMAFIWKLEDMTRKSELKNITPDNRRCTSKPREWGKGGRREVEFSPVMALKITKPRHASYLPGRKKRSIDSQFYDPRPLKSQKLDADGIVKLRQDLQKINARIPFAAMLPEEKTIQTVMTIVGTVAKGSTVHKQLQDYSRQPPNLVVPYFSSSSLAGKENVNPVSNGQALNSNSSLNHEISAPPSTVQCESEMNPLALLLMIMMSYSFSRYQIVMLITNSKNRIFQVLLKVQLIHLKHNSQQPKQKHYLLKLLQTSRSKLKWQQEDNQRILLGLNKSKTE